MCSWCGSSPNEDYAGNSLLRRDERTGGPTAMEGWNPAVPRSPAEYATGADTQPGMAFIAAGAPPRDINENDVAEQAHHRLKDVLDQALMLRGSRDVHHVAWVGDLSGGGEPPVPLQGPGRAHM